LPVAVCGPYGEGDAINTLLLYELLIQIVDREGTRAAYRLECDLMPMTIAMRRRGIRVDQNATEQGRDYCLQKRDRALAELSGQLGTHISMDEIASKNWLVRTFNAHHVNYPRTKKGNPSFKGGKLGWMATHPHWRSPALGPLGATGLQQRGRSLLARRSTTTHPRSRTSLVSAQATTRRHPHRAERANSRRRRAAHEVVDARRLA
jgi:hypothetical protein